MDVHVACPSKCATGGVELLHQLTKELNKNERINAKIWYRGKQIDDPTPEEYKSYHNEYIITPVPKENTVLIFPEIYASWANMDQYKNHYKVIYWESVDNYFKWTSEKEQFKFPEGTIHLAQSYYAKQFLEHTAKIDPKDIIMVTDYINDIYFKSRKEKERYDNVVLYNPHKGMEFTQELIDAASDIEFKPLDEYTTKEMIDLMSRCRLYIDFGDHPGKDRIPREAALCGCAIITGKDGSAANKEDVAIPGRYKYDRAVENISSIIKRIREVLADYDELKKDFDPYREKIADEKKEFEESVAELADRLADLYIRFSIIIPTHNSEAYIRKALDSVACQEFKDYELIVVCDSCDDDTEKIAKSYGARIEHTDCHCDGPTRSRGIDVARGEWLLFMDDDDWWLHEYVLTQLDDKLKEVGDIDVLCFSFIFKGWKYASPLGNNGKRWIATWNKCWRRAFVGDSRFPKVKMSSDVYFNDSVFGKNPKVAYWDMPMYYYNFMREGSQTEVDRRNS